MQNVTIVKQYWNKSAYVVIFIEYGKEKTMQFESEKEARDYFELD